LIEIVAYGIVRDLSRPISPVFTSSVNAGCMNQVIALGDAYGGSLADHEECHDNTIDI
jgi:hypothetical protein